MTEDVPVTLMGGMPMLRLQAGLVPGLVQLGLHHIPQRSRGERPA